jgi:hypothetical protein
VRAQERKPDEKAEGKGGAPRTLAEAVSHAAFGSGPTSPDTTLALQRAIGNRAVSRALDQEEHVHGAGCGHQEPTAQRALVDEALSSPGRKIESSRRTRLESFFQTDLSDVTVHTGDVAQRSATALGAHAYTVGTDIVLGAGAAASDAILAHEAGHAVKNKSGVRETGNDNGAGLSVTNPSQDSEVAAAADGDAFAAGAEHAPSITMQRVAIPGAAAGTPVQRMAVGEEHVAVEAATTDTTVQRAASGRPAGMVVQRAGGHGGRRDRHGGRIVQKPTNEAEAKFYEQVRDGAHPGYEDIVPQSYSAYQVSQLDHETGGNDSDHIYLANLTHGMSRPRMIDIKIGSATASKQELRQAMSNAAAFMKKMRLEAADVATGSSSRGYRVVSGPGDEGSSRAKVGYQSSKYIEQYSESATVYQELVIQLRHVRDVVRAGGLAHIAASVLIAVDEAPTAGQPVVRADSVKLIDFAHTFGSEQVSERQLTKYRDRFDAGLTDLIHDMERSGSRKR